MDSQADSARSGVDFRSARRFVEIGFFGRPVLFGFFDGFGYGSEIGVVGGVVLVIHFGEIVREIVLEVEPIGGLRLEGSGFIERGLAQAFFIVEDLAGSDCGFFRTGFFQLFEFGSVVRGAGQFGMSGCKPCAPVGALRW